MSLGDAAVFGLGVLATLALLLGVRLVQAWQDEQARSRTATRAYEEGHR